MADDMFSSTAERSYEETVTAVDERDAPAGFGVLTEIDLPAVAGDVRARVSAALATVSAIAPVKGRA